MGLNLERLKPINFGPRGIEIIEPTIGLKLPCVDIPGETAVAIDVGSTKIAIEIHSWQRGQLDRKPNEAPDKHWIHYKTQTHSLEVRGKKLLLHWKTTDGLKLYEMVSAKISQMLAQFGLMPEELNSIIITGLTNSLAVEHQGRVIVILDEPSLTTPLNEQEKISLEKHGIDEPLKASSSLMKLLTLKRYPKVVKAIFGPKAEFKNLHFNSMLGLVAGAFQENSFPAIPLTDLYGFTTQRQMSLKEAQTMLAELGFSSSQIDFMPDLAFQPPLTRETYYFINDFTAEAEYFAALWQIGVLNEGDVVMSTDSVGKLIFPPSTNYSKKTIKVASGNYLPYCTQRMTGTVFNAWIGLLLETNTQEKAFFSQVNDIIGKGIDEKNNPFLFNPQGRDPHEGKIGSLYRIENGVPKLISQEEALNLSLKEKEEIIRAIARGIFFGLRRKIEDSGASPTRIICYGGMILDRFWRETIAQCFEGLEVSTINIASGIQAAVACISRLKGNNSHLQPSISKVEISSPLKNREDEYNKWKQFLD